MAIPYKKIEMGISNTNIAFKRQMRFAFIIDGVSFGGGLDTKICHKAARPNFSFKEIALEHFNETIYMPGKVEWKPIQITLYDTWNTMTQQNNPLFIWLASWYRAKDALYGFAGQNIRAGFQQWKKNAYLNMYDGSGCIIESWLFENAWPQDINFNEVDYSSNDVMSVDLTLRYDRAYPVSD
jgi:hypothetical protein